MKYGIIYGSLIGVLIVSVAITNYYLGTSTINVFIRIASVLAAITTIVLALKKVKQEKYNGVINYAQCLFHGFYIAAFAGIFCALLNTVFLTTVATDYKERSLKLETELLKSQNLPEEEMTKELAKITESLDIRRVAGGTFLFTSFLSMIVVIIASSFIRNKDTFNASNLEVPPLT